MEENTVDHRLPKRLFATDRFPRHRLNIYSRPNILAFVRHVLRYSPAFGKIRESSFRKLFDLPTRQIPVSCKLIHNLLSCQLLCNQEYTLWSVFGKDPLRFSLEEFETITGLNCGVFPEGYEAPDYNRKGANKQKVAHKDPLLQKIIGKYNNITISDLAAELENDKQMDEWRRIRLALIIIVDGVLIASQQIHRPTLRYVHMLEDVMLSSNSLGSVNLSCTLNIPSHRVPTSTAVTRFQSHTYVAVEDPCSFKRTIMDLTDPNLTNHPSIEQDSVLLVEDNPTLLVIPLIPVLRGPQPGWGLWSNEKTYDNVTYMEQLIANNHCFSKTVWPGGDCWEPVFTFTPTPEEPIHKKHTVLRKRKESKLKPHKIENKGALHACKLPRLQPPVLPTRKAKSNNHRTLIFPNSTNMLLQTLREERSTRRQMVALCVLNLLFSVNTRPNIIILDEVISTISSVPTMNPRTTTLLTTTNLINTLLTTTPLTNTPMTTTLLTTTPLINTLQTTTPPTPLLTTALLTTTLLTTTLQTPIPPTTALLTTTLQTPTHRTTALLTTTPLTTTLLPTNHLNSPNHKPLNHEPEYPTSPDHNSTEPTISLAHRSPNHHSSNHVSPANNSGVPRSPMFTLSGPVFNTPISPTHRPPPHAALSPQGRFSTHFSTPNAFAATAVLKGSTSAFPTTPSSLIDEEQKSEHGVGKLSDSSPDKTAQTRDHDVCELSDSSTARKIHFILRLTMKRPSPKPSSTALIFPIIFL
ncbi:LOW QUALITY PROTEIN: hypothetical protein HID58_043373 [Brassica napus]|uniref:DUF1985 domain-containing protein n=1 Tax=Brassica napus TaxID=3708 RepID=A0ABQ8BGE0_BRANA|nr:LOW QUALITY PROTEIN: hypothetical protein HID58_043373 [Brassica napus]